MVPYARMIRDAYIWHFVQQCDQPIGAGDPHVAKRIDIHEDGAPRSEILLSLGIRTFYGQTHRMRPPMNGINDFAWEDNNGIYLLP